MAIAKRLDELLTRSAERNGSQTAVEDPGRGSINYSDLDAAVRAVSAALESVGVMSGDRVGICAPKSIGTVTAILGTLRVGAAYVPVDATAPPERNAYIFDDCSVRAILGRRDRVFGATGVSRNPQAWTVTELKVPGAHDAFVLAARPNGAGCELPSSAKGLAYILYTSGSTGRPKGVMHSHDSAISFLDWCSHELQPTMADRFSSHAPFHFDLSILDLYLPLKHGATLVLIDEECGKQPQRLAQLISERRISIWYSTPSILRLLVEYGKMNRFEYRDLRIVCYAGEVFPPKHQRALRAYWPHPAYYNLYGPTETNVCTFDRVTDTPPDDCRGALPIGRVCSGDRARIGGTDGAEVAIGEEGELLVSGGSVMLGYWNLPERDERAFAYDEDGTRWYRTGDIVIDEGGGYYRFLGRRDRMVKRHGYRVELGEIEAALLLHESINEVGAIAVADPESGVLIKAYITCTGDDHPTVIELKSFLAEHLPAYMIPDRIVILASLPKTSTDKLDYQKLGELGE